MNNEQQAEMSMLSNVEAELSTDSTAYANDQNFKDKVEKFLLATAANRDAAAAAFPDNSGYSDMKNDTKDEMCEMAVILTAPAKVALRDLGKASEGDKLSVNITDFSILADSACEALARKNYNVLSTNSSVLIPNTFTQVALDDFSDKIELFHTQQGTSGEVHGVSPVLTQNFENSFIPCRLLLDDLKLMSKKYIQTNNGFFTRFNKSTKIPAINIHHTYVTITTTEKGNDKPVEGIIYTLEKAKKSAVSNYNGIAVIEKVRCGTDKLTGVFNNKELVNTHIKILRGKNNPFSYKVEF